ISAVLVKVRKGWNTEELLRRLRELPDVSAHTADGERQIMLGGFVARSRRQIRLFRTILLIVSTVVMTLVLFMLTMDKVHDIAMLKLLGARNGVMIEMILTQALLIGCLAFGIARFLGQWAYPLFPRRVVLVTADLWLLFAIVVGVSILASVAGVVKAMLTDAGEVLS
ncbi:MAG: ABC transporter permease, partial [Lentisphaeria bacterium]|nr:ABC transporter permease [Lentisphaeria bacterium]